MLNLIVYCFSQFLRKIMNFLILIPIFLAWNVLDSENFAWIFTWGHIFTFHGFLLGQNWLWKGKNCGKDQLKCDFYIIILNYRASISGFDHFRYWMTFILLIFIARSQKLTILWPLEDQILLWGDSKDGHFTRE